MDPQRSDGDAEEGVDDQAPLQDMAQLQVLARAKGLATKSADGTRQPLLQGREGLKLRQSLAANLLAVTSGLQKRSLGEERILLQVT